MESRRTEPACDQDDAQRHGGLSQTEERQQCHGDNRPDEKQRPRPPSVGDMTEAELGHRVGHLEAHLQRSGSRKRQIELRDEQRKQRRVDVAESVDQEMSAGEQQHCRVQSETLPHGPARRSFRITIAAPSRNSGIRRKCAAAESTPRATAIDAASRRICRIRLPPGSHVIVAASTAATAMAMAVDANAIRPNDRATRRSSSPPSRRLSSTVKRAALKRAAIDVPSARPRYPISRTSMTFRTALTTTVAMLTFTGVRFSPSA